MTFKKLDMRRLRNSARFAFIAVSLGGTVASLSILHGGPFGNSLLFICMPTFFALEYSLAGHVSLQFVFLSAFLSSVIVWTTLIYIFGDLRSKISQKQIDKRRLRDSAIFAFLFVFIGGTIGFFGHGAQSWLDAVLLVVCLPTLFVLEHILPPNGGLLFIFLSSVIVWTVLFYVFGNLYSRVVQIRSKYTSYASVPMASKEQDAAAKQFSPPPKNKAGLYMYRNLLKGQALKKRLLLDGVVIGATANKTFFYREIMPGKHTLATESEFGDNSITLQTDAGKNYFVQQYIKMGAFVSGAGLNIVDEETGKKEVLDCELAK
jgi:hypothetical protein